jgi:hypothetical protein
MTRPAKMPPKTNATREEPQEGELIKAIIEASQPKGDKTTWSKPVKPKQEALP